MWITCEFIFVFQTLSGAKGLTASERLEKSFATLKTGCNARQAAEGLPRLFFIAGERSKLSIVNEQCSTVNDE